MAKCRDASLAEFKNIGLLSKAGSPECLGHRAEQRRVFVEHHLNRDLREEGAEFFFFTKGTKKCAIFHFFANLDGDPAVDPHAAAVKSLHGQVSGFGAGTPRLRIAISDGLNSARL